MIIEVDTHTDPKGADWYCYEDPISNKIIIGVRGQQEMKIDRWDWVRAEDSFRLKNGRHRTPEEAIRWAINYSRKQSEYVPFEEVKPNNILLGVGKHGRDTNQTK